MKKKLLKPPGHNGELFFSPEAKEFITGIKQESRIGVCHQPYFFNPGISLKFLYLENLPSGIKNIIFLDTDRINIKIKIPYYGGGIKIVSFLNTHSVLSDYPMPQKDAVAGFFSTVADDLSKLTLPHSRDIISNFSGFRDIFSKNSNKRFLKEALAESFLQFYNIRREYCFLSDLIRGKEFNDFFLKIYKDSEGFREVFNTALDEYRAEFKFRFKNFPFPKLEEGELPFWIVKDGIRIRCFKKDLNPADVGKLMIFPRAATLTIFLRVYKLDFFIHGIGGANYEWIQDRIIERFFKQTAPLFAVASGTFLIDSFKERQFPYFLFKPGTVSDRLLSFL